MSVKEEFATVDLVLNSSAETRGVDSFALSIIKAERQMRKLITYLVFQSPAFQSSDIADLRNALAARKIFFRHFLAAWDKFYVRPLHELIGTEHIRLRKSLIEATKYRNKIFHGQLTTKYLSYNDLKAYVTDIKCWCELLAVAASREIGYDGFDRTYPSGSFRKSTEPTLADRIVLKFRTVHDYESFLKELEHHSNDN